MSSLCFGRANAERPAGPGIIWGFGEVLCTLLYIARYGGFIGERGLRQGYCGRGCSSVGGVLCQMARVNKFVHIGTGLFGCFVSNDYIWCQITLINN